MFGGEVTIAIIPVWDGEENGYNHTSLNIRWSSKRSIKDHTEQRESQLELVKKCMRHQRQDP